MSTPFDKFTGKALKGQYPELLKDYSAEEVEEVWESYSAEICAGWIGTDHEPTVRSIFSKAPKYFEYKKNNPDPKNDYDNYAGRYFSWG